MSTLVNAVGMMLALGASLGFALGIADKFLRVEADPRVETVTSMLPNYNCGGCGYAGCAGFAEALVNGEAKKVTGCKPSKAEARTAIIDYLANTPGPDGSTVNVTL